MIFAAAADPFFSLLSELQDKFKFVDLHSPPSPLFAFRGCADDIGGGLSSFKLLRLVEPIFQKAFDLANSSLNVKKCVIIPSALHQRDY